MKLQKSIIGIGVLLLSLSSCDDFLDRMPDDKKNEVDVFTRYEQVDNLVTDLYARAKTADFHESLRLCRIDRRMYGFQP